jgi:transitional endoplasmic reticulum ATPase
LIDQLELVLPKRGTSATSEGGDERIVTSFLTEMDGVFSTGGSSVFIVGVTSKKELVDLAILRPGRIDIHVEIPMPDFESRVQILGSVIRRMPNAVTVEEVDLIARRTNGVNSVSLVDMCREAAMVCIRTGAELLTINQFALVNKII